MAEKMMLIIPAELVQKIDDNRGDTSRSEFIELLIDSQLKEETKDRKPAPQYATKEELVSLEEDIKKLLKSFLDFFLHYGLKIGKESKDNGLEEITSKLKELEKDADKSNEKGRATIKWK